MNTTDRAMVLSFIAPRRGAAILDRSQRSAPMEARVFLTITGARARITVASRSGSNICNLYSITKSQAAIIAATRTMVDSVGNLPPLPGICSRPPSDAQLVQPPRQNGTRWATLKAGCYDSRH